MTKLKDDLVPVILESPFAGKDAVERAIHAAYRQACIRDSLGRGEAPFASHQMYTQALDDRMPEDRDLGTRAGFAWHGLADRSVVYTDRGISPGMIAGIENAARYGRGVEYRALGGWWAMSEKVGAPPDETDMLPTSPIPAVAQKSAERWKGSLPGALPKPLPLPGTRAFDYDFTLRPSLPEASQLFRPDLALIPAKLYDELGRPKTTQETHERLMERMAKKDELAAKLLEIAEGLPDRVLHNPLTNAEKLIPLCDAIQRWQSVRVGLPKIDAPDPTEKETFTVDYLDQDGEVTPEVWAEYESWIETEREARTTAAMQSALKQHKRARVYRVMRVLVAEYHEGKEKTP